ncbi:hypothetical protein BDK51DRAFT_16775 [Blyttiomyces helicus]|uniref:Protoporphyrinogen oxidase n=1 Tax=Blyttiomyces helicus TaxID=388810 RepID=A0A4P9W181_9FUNG|nr:hypothetical protein BDK51DRAFT_16775 [Blyttiomyces helicus]|eukprot:RKO84903.1 hypothetical protein BDK51DRAFT_16775 [Blyttiomyces helicus]
MSKHITVLGAGISGLTAAWTIAQRLPGAKISLVEASTAHIGGWVHSIRKNGELFELGPRTLRPTGEAGTVTLDMIHQLGLSPNVLTVPKTSPAALNRFIYHNDTINQLPSSLPKLLTNPPSVLKGLVPTVLAELFRAKISSTQSDESIHSFVSRRFAPWVADNLVSAIVHGIYAGDVKTLSVRSTLGMLWENEQGAGSVIRGLVKGKPPLRVEDFARPDAVEFVKSVQGESIYSFREGMQTLTDALRDDLEGRENVEILRAAGQKVGVTGEGKVQLSTSQTLTSDYIISAIPSHLLSPLLPSSTRTPTLLSQTPNVSVAVVNLAFAARLPISGFGYLVPSSQPSTILGTVFDSDAMPEQQSSPAGPTRITVMMGGHRFPALFPTPDSATPEALRDTAIKAVETHLGLRLDPIVAWNAAVQRDCIPQYIVGHRARMGELRTAVGREFGGRVALVGASYLGVSVNDCVMHARNAGRAVAEAVLAGDGRPVTGLEGLDRLP